MSINIVPLNATNSLNNGYRNERPLKRLKTSGPEQESKVAYEVTVFPFADDHLVVNGRFRERNVHTDEYVRMPLSWLTTQSLFVQSIKDVSGGKGPLKEVPLMISAQKENIFKYIRVYISHHKDELAELISKPLSSCDMHALCKDPWDAHFIDNIVSEALSSPDYRYLLTGLLLEALRLDMPGLVNLAEAKIATIIKTSSPMELCKILSLL